MSDTTVRLSFPAKPDYLLLARLALGGVVREMPVGPELLADLKLAVTEACGNAVRHAYDDGDGMVEVAFVVHDDRLDMIVEDKGSGIALPLLEQLLEAEPVAEACADGRRNGACHHPRDRRRARRSRRRRRSRDRRPHDEVSLGALRVLRGFLRTRLRMKPCVAGTHRTARCSLSRPGIHEYRGSLRPCIALARSAPPTKASL